MKLLSSYKGLIFSIVFWPALIIFLFIVDLGDNQKDKNLPIGDKTAVASIAIDTQIQTSALPEPEKVNYSEVKGELKSGEGFDDSLKRCGLDANVRTCIINALNPTLDFRKLRPGDQYTVVLDEDGKLVSSTYESGPLNIYSVVKTDDGYSSVKLSIPLECQTTRITGTIDNSLFVSFVELGEDPKLIHSFANIFASKIDFNTETRQGDSFSLIVEKFYKDDEFVAYGKILMARYQQADKSWSGYLYNTEKNPGAYFDDNGEELSTSFLRSPIPFGRVTSRFSFRRKHPILGITRPHLGVDLAAPTGTPVMAASDGRIKFIGRNGGFGKQVIIRHAGGYKTHYGHLSRYKKGLRTGNRVKQKDIIGYVGSTGLSTGPHLDYRIDLNGVFKNPFSLKFKPRSILKGDELKDFNIVSTELVNLMETQVDHKVLQVKNVTLGVDEDLSSFL